MVKKTKRFDLRIFNKSDELNQFAANYFCELAELATNEKGNYLVALSGGNTPQCLYQLLAEPVYRNRIPWLKTHIFWCDERCVPPDHLESNFFMAHQILLSKIPLPTENIHRMRGELPPDEAANEYANMLKSFPMNDHSSIKLDLVMLGLGIDGHIASLFPGPISQKEKKQTVIAVTAQYANRPARRITLTPKLINTSNHVLFMVTGKEKANAVYGTLRVTRDAEKWPGQRIRPTHGNVIWAIDQEAASLLLEGIDPYEE